MSRDRRVLTYVAIALIVGASLALAVALSSSGAAGSPAASGDEPAVSASGLYSDDEGAALAATDPAQQQSLLDKFTSKDPFIPFPTPGATAAPPADTNGSGDTGKTEPSDLSAKIKVDGTSYTVTPGDKVPGGSAAAFRVTSVASGDVTFAVIDGALENGDKSFTLAKGDSGTYTLDSGVSYKIQVTDIVARSSGGNGSGGSGAKGHSISVLNINSQNGVATATFEVDGKTFSDKRVGDTFSTSWGEFEVITIDVKNQVVTVRHGDQTLKLYVGQVIVK